MSINEEIKALADRYGYDSQSRQCIEEMAELTQAINKFWRNNLKCGPADRAIHYNASNKRCCHGGYDKR